MCVFVVVFSRDSIAHFTTQDGLGNQTVNFKFESWIGWKKLSRTTFSYDFWSEMVGWKKSAWTTFSNEMMVLEDVGLEPEILKNHGLVGKTLSSRSCSYDFGLEKDGKCWPGQFFRPKDGLGDVGLDPSKPMDSLEKVVQANFFQRIDGFGNYRLVS